MIWAIRAFREYWERTGFSDRSRPIWCRPTLRKPAPVAEELGFDSRRLHHYFLKISICYKINRHSVNFIGTISTWIYNTWLDQTIYQKIPPGLAEALHDRRSNSINSGNPRHLPVNAHPHVKPVLGCFRSTSKAVPMVLWPSTRQSRTYTKNTPKGKRVLTACFE